MIGKRDCQCGGSGILNIWAGSGISNVMGGKVDS